MNDVLELKGTFEPGTFKGRVGAPSLPKGTTVNVTHINNLLEQLNEINDIWSTNQTIGGALLDVHYSSVVAKSNRIKALLKEKGRTSNDSIRGAKFDDSNAREPKHIFTYFVSLDALKETIEKLERTVLFLDEKFSGEINQNGMTLINKGLVKDEELKKSVLAQIIVDVCRVESISLPDIVQPSDGYNIVTIYKTNVKANQLLMKLGIQINKNGNKELDENTFLLDKNDIDLLNEKMPYIVSMGVANISEWDSTVIEANGDYGHISISSPNNEPIVGVIDTQFDDSVYFHEWVESYNMLEENIPIRPEDKFHGTEVCSIIVDGPSINPKLEDGCGHFRVRHFGVAVNGPMNSVSIMRNIDKIIKNNTDIKVWNISLGAVNEVQKNFISPEGALLDRLQNEYDIVFVIAGTNKKSSEKIEKRIGAPADSLNSIVVNSVGLDNKPASYSRTGPVLSFFHKPDVSYFGGDGKDSVAVCSSYGKELRVGTSYAAPWITRKMAFLIYRMGLSREVAKALLIDAAADWDRHDDVSFKTGFGVVPTHINDILRTREDEIRFVISNTIAEYETFNYNIPIPQNEKGFPFFARATLVYYPKCDRNQGVDYTCTELDIHFGRAREKNGKVCIEPINRNSQGEENGFGLYEGKARDLFRKWDNVKHISERLNPKARAKAVFDSAFWGLMIRCTERLDQKNGRGMRFGVVITMREMNGENRIQDFINLCRIRGWIVNPLSIDVMNTVYNIGEEEVEWE